MTRTTLLFAGVLALLGGIYLATLRTGHEWGDDFSLYVAHARNLVEGRPYGNTGYIYNPDNAVLSPRCYPPIFPLLLAPVYAVFGLDLMAMKVFVNLLFLVVLGLLALLYRQRLPLAYAVVCLVLFALNPYVWQHKDRLLSEMPFMLFAYLTLLLAEKAQEQEGTRRRSILLGLLAGLAAYLAFGTRSVGVVLLPAMLGCEWLRRRRLGAASLAMMAACVGGVVVQKCFLVLDVSYRDQLIFDPLIFLRIGLSLVKLMGTFVENGSSRGLTALLYGVLLVLACWGYTARLRQGVTVYELFAAFNCLLLLFWPAAEFETRYLMPILPLFFLYVGEGLVQLRSLSVGRLERPLAALLAAAILVSYAGKYRHVDAGPVRDGVSTAEAVALFDWIKDKTDPQDVFMFQKPRALALYARRQAVAHHKLADDEQLWSFLRRLHVSHLVVSESSANASFQNSRRLLHPFVERHGDRFEKVYENPGFRVYRLREPVLASQ